jgi:hypothetical protein
VQQTSRPENIIPVTMGEVVDRDWCCLAGLLSFTTIPIAKSGEIGFDVASLIFVHSAFVTIRSSVSSRRSVHPQVAGSPQQRSVLVATRMRGRNELAGQKAFSRSPWERWSIGGCFLAGLFYCTAVIFVATGSCAIQTGSARIVHLIVSVIRSKSRPSVVHDLSGLAYQDSRAEDR